MQSDVFGSSLCVGDHKFLCEFTLAHLLFPKGGQDAVNECQCICVAVVGFFIIPREKTSLVT